MVLPVELNKNIIDFLASLPSIDGSDGQQAFINGAALDSELQSQIKYSGSSAQFITLLVPQLVRYGKLRDGRNALEAILKVARNQVGQDKREYCDELLQQLRVASSSEEQPSKTLKISANKQKSGSEKLQIFANWAQIVSFILAIIVWIWPQPDIKSQRIVLIILAYIIYALITVFLHFKSKGIDWNFARWIGLIALTIIIFLLYTSILSSNSAQVSSTNLCNYYGFEISEPAGGFILDNGKTLINGTLTELPPHQTVWLMTIADNPSRSYWPQSSVTVDHSTKKWNGVIYSLHDVTAAIVILGDDGQTLFDYFDRVEDIANAQDADYPGLTQLTKDVQICKTVIIRQRNN